MKTQFLEQLVQLALEVESQDPIDWGMLGVDERTAYTMMATSILENYGNPHTERELVLMATVVKLVVENFTINLKLLGNTQC